jgi:hypothetical protein
MQDQQLPNKLIPDIQLNKLKKEGAIIFFRCLWLID